MKNLKPVIQQDLKDCGVACMQYIFTWYDGYLTLEKLREDTLTNVNGTNAYNIVTAFKKWGFDAKGVLVHDIQSKELNFPLIAHLRLKNGLEHFVVVREVINNNLYLMDPGKGYVKMNLTKFKELFTGHVILVSPRESIVKMQKGLTIKDLFLNILMREKYLFIKIILASLLWTILSIIGSFYLKVGSNLISSNADLLKYLITIFSIITIFKIIFFYIREYYKNHLSNLVDVYLYPEFIKHIFYLPLKSIKTRSTGEIVTRINDLGNIKSLFTDILVSCLLDSVMMLLSMVILIFINWQLFLILIIFILIYALYGILTSKLIYKKVLENIQYQTDFNSVIVEDIAALESIKNLNIIEIMLKRLEGVLAKFLHNNYRFTSSFNKITLGKDFILELCFLIINSYGFTKIIQGSLSIIDLFTFNLILSYCLEPVKNIVSVMPKYNYIKASFAKITEFINIEREDINESKVNLDGDIVFENASFSYNNYDYIFKDLNLVIKNKEHTLLNGASGQGKSTICKLIYKEFNLNSGNILIDGVNTKDLSLSDIRDNILYVSQNEELITGTILENILLDRDVNQDYLKDILKICEIESIVKKKPLRYNSLIESSRQNISGGEAQRIILARALLKKVNILILDEALSEVDSKLESKIIKNIRAYFKDKTIIYISHKNQTRNFENIITIGGK